MVRVETVKALGGLRVRLGFTDGTVKSLDLTPFLEGPIFEELKRDRSLFGRGTRRRGRSGAGGH